MKAFLIREGLSIVRDIWVTCQTPLAKKVGKYSFVLSDPKNISKIKKWLSNSDNRPPNALNKLQTNKTTHWIPQDKRKPFS